MSQSVCVLGPQILLKSEKKKTMPILLDSVRTSNEKSGLEL